MNPYRTAAPTDPLTTERADEGDGAAAIGFVLFAIGASRLGVAVAGAETWGPEATTTALFSMLGALEIWRCRGRT